MNQQKEQVKENREMFYELLGSYIKKQLVGRFSAYKSATLLSELREGKRRNDEEIMTILDSYKKITLPLGYKMRNDFFDYGDRYWNNVNRTLEVAGLAKRKYDGKRDWHFEFKARVEQSIGDGWVLRS